MTNKKENWGISCRKTITGVERYSVCFWSRSLQKLVSVGTHSSINQAKHYRDEAFKRDNDCVQCPDQFESWIVDNFRSKKTKIRKTDLGDNWGIWPYQTKNNGTRYRLVVWVKARKRTKYLGTFSSLEEAKQERDIWLFTQDRDL